MVMMTPLSHRPLSRPQVIAHRGRCSPNSPENTVSGALAALEAGCDGVEVDVRRTKDGELVLMHDPTPMRTTFAREAGGDRVRRHPVESSCLADLRLLGVRSTARVEHPEWLVPLLSEVLLPAVRRGSVVVIDVKEAPSGLVWPSLTRELGGLPVNWRRHVVVQSRCASDLLRLRRALPGITTSLMVAWGAVPTAHQEGGPTMTSRPWWAASAPTIAREHAQGRRIFAWTVNKRRQMIDLVGRGVDGIITDDPPLLLKLSESLALHSDRPDTVRASA